MKIKSIQSIPLEYKTSNKEEEEGNRIIYDITKKLLEKYSPKGNYDISKRNSKDHKEAA